MSQGMEPLPRAKNTTKMRVAAMRNGPMSSFCAIMIRMAITSVPTKALSDIIPSMYRWQMTDERKHIP